MENEQKDIKIEKTLAFLRQELKNFENIAARIKPASGEIPKLKGIDIYGEAIPLNGVAGGDHLIYVDFNKRYDLDHRIAAAQKEGRPDVVEKLKLNKHRGGVLLADAAGHNVTDALLAAMLHQAFLTGVQYELKDNGEVTTELFEILNTRFFNSSSLSRFITLIYGEISEAGVFRFINAAHPLPVVYSHSRDQLIEVCFQQYYRFPPIGTLPSKEDVDLDRNVSRLGYKKKYNIHEINLTGKGDILLLYTDGFSEHGMDTEVETLYFTDRLEKKLRSIKEGTAKEIYLSLKEDLFLFAEPHDDISFVIIKKT